MIIYKLIMFNSKPILCIKNVRFTFTSFGIKKLFSTSTIICAFFENIQKRHVSKYYKIY